MSGDSIHLWFFGYDVSFAEVLRRTLGPTFELRVNRGFEIAEQAAPEGWCDAVMIDFRDSETEGSLEALRRLMEQIREADVPPPMVVMLGADERALTHELIQGGAYATVPSPPDMAELSVLLRRAHRAYEAERELRRLRLEGHSARLNEIIATAEPMQQVVALAQKIAPCDVNVLVTGETGTGKELLARAIHRWSPRAAAPFIAFSCANLPETLVEDELFGHERGAFTGAVGLRRGRFEVADKGTLFLDEVGDLPLNLQAKLLRVIQERTFERLGSSTPVTVNIRLICATHRNLEEMVRQGVFRDDLYYRLNVVQLHLPPLRDRRDSVPVMANRFLLRFSHQFGKKARRFSPMALHALEEYLWPGNVRELENVIQRAVVVSEGTSIELAHLPPALRSGFEQPRSLHSYDEEVRDFKRRLIVRTLRDCGGNKAETARALGLARGYLHRLINQLRIQDEEGEEQTLLGEQPPAARVM